jgi:hypothetical protein
MMLLAEGEGGARGASKKHCFDLFMSTQPDPLIAIARGGGRGLGGGGGPWVLGARVLASAGGGGWALLCCCCVEAVPAAGGRMPRAPPWRLLSARYCVRAHPLL